MFVVFMFVIVIVMLFALQFLFRNFNRKCDSCKQKDIKARQSHMAKTINVVADDDSDSDIDD